MERRRKGRKAKKLEFGGVGRCSMSGKKKAALG
jgi:hypothetical protein